MKIVKILLITFVLTSLINCKSIEKYNTEVSKNHSVSELHEDIDYAYKKLQKWHPNLYQYISKDSLDYHFNNLKNSITKPMNSIEFSKILAPVISKIGQGHTSLRTAHMLQTKADKKKRGKRKSIFRHFRFNTLNGKVYVEKFFKKDKDSAFLVGSRLLKIDNKDINDLYNLFKTQTTGDGYNQTFMKEFPLKAIGSFYNKTHKLKDSLKLTFYKNDSTYNRYFYAYKIINKKDSLNKTDKKKLSKSEKRIAKKKQKAKDKWNYKYGYNKITKEITLNLDFIKANDTSKTVAYMKIRNFMKGNYKKFFKESFKKIDSLKLNYLIIDLRDNLGGRLSEIADLYSYLTTKEHQFIEPSKMTRANSFYYPLFHNKSTLLKILTPITFPIAKVIQLTNVKKINGEHYFKFKNSKLQKPKKEYNFKGKVYVLINGTSFSASSVLSNKLQATNRAFFVGDETGGAYNTTVAGMFAYFELPNSKNSIRSGLMVLDTPHKTEPDGYGVKPDKFIKVTTLNKDEQLDWILEDLSTLKD